MEEAFFWLFTACAHWVPCWTQLSSATVLPVEVQCCCRLDGHGGAVWSSRPVWTAGLEHRPPPRLFPFPSGWGVAGCRPRHPHSPWNQKNLHPWTTPSLQRSPWSSLREKDRDRFQTEWCVLHCHKVRHLNTPSNQFTGCSTLTTHQWVHVYISSFILFKDVKT